MFLCHFTAHVLCTVFFNSVNENSPYKGCDLWNFSAVDSGKIKQRHGTLFIYATFSAHFPNLIKYFKQ